MGRYDVELMLGGCGLDDEGYAVSYSSVLRDDDI